ncbi:TonB-dependent receptor [Neolewinella lacunae]|uniref:TonB-dependent receptor n=1 Tax=Neolewinella lacunae TaxID=1517758 RepID=A0A923PK09_9BACT|nr:TonB-dependent receptor [Neolewinella lacunae]MBC6993980.1 TonB-dependent receptor [Neolewinella lacunae]MDN3635505.1 TonB-dependent receptor [Neolewinella lacunae]
MLKRILTIVVLLCAAGTIFSQKGAISGTVYDEKGEPLPAANILLEGTTIGATTDYIEGKYQFQADPGVYTIVASFLGYADVKITGVEIKANETKLLDIVFDPEAAGGVDLAEIVVTAEAMERGEVAVMKLRQNDVNAKDIISSQEMSSLGASTVSQALAKVTGTTVVGGKYVYVRGLGDRYSATTINGLRLPSIDPYRNSAQLDLIPTDILDNISASKTFTPNLPGDFTGGSVDVKIKALPERFTWGVSVGTSVNTQSNFQNDFLTYEGNAENTFGYASSNLDLPVDLDDQRYSDLGTFSRGAVRRARTDDELAASLEEVTDAFGSGFGIEEARSPMNYSVSANIGNQFKLGSMPLGVFATISASKDYFAYNGGITGQYLTPGLGATALQEVFDLRRDLSEESADLGGMVGLNLRLSPSSNISFYTLYSHQGTASVKISQGSYEAKGASGEADNNFVGRESAFLERELTDYVLQGEHTLRKLGNIKVDWTANYVTSSQQEPDFRYIEYIEQATSILNDPSQFRQPSRFFRDLADESYEGKLDFTVPFLAEASRANTIKFGGQYRTKERDFNERQVEYFQRAGNGQTFSELGGDFEQYFGDDNSGIIGGEPGSNEIGISIINTTSQGNSYVGTDEVAAGYLMATYEIGTRLKLTGGVRAENTRIDIASDIADIVDPSNRPLQVANIDTTNIMPAFNFVYKTMPNHNLRGSFSQTVARPNMRELAPFASFNGVDPDVVGNVNLQLSNIDNYDLRYEIFPENAPGEVISLSAFYKRFTNPIVVTFLPGGGGNQQFTWTNTEGANLYGIEFEIRKSLAFISPSLSNFTLSNNLAVIQSNQDIADRECEQGISLNENYVCERPFNGQSDFVFNANLAYRTPGENSWDAILAYNFFSDRLQSIGRPGTPDIFEQGRSQLDLSISKNFNNLKVSLRAQNLIDPDFRSYSTFLGQEYDFTRYQRGRTFSLSLSYGI